MFLSFLLSCVAIVKASDVVDLDPSNFDKIVDGSRYALVEFYAPWCGHCKNLAPVYEELATSFSSKKSSLVIAKVDADAHKELGARFGVQGFPTIKWFGLGDKKGEPYEGDRSLEAFQGFISSKSQIYSKKVPKARSHVVDLDTSNFASIALDPTKNVLVEFFAPWCGHCKSLVPIYETLATYYQTEKENCVIAKVDATSNEQLAGQYGVRGYPTILLFGKGEEKKPISYDKNRDLESFVYFLNQHCGTLVTPQGYLDDHAGVLMSFNEIVDKFISSTDISEKKKSLDSLKSAIESIKKENQNVPPYFNKAAPYYVRLFEKLMNSSDPHNDLMKEHNRLHKILDSFTPPISTDPRMHDMWIRRNVLRSFASRVTGGREEL